MNILESVYILLSKSNKVQTQMR